MEFLAATIIEAACQDEDCTRSLEAFARAIRFDPSDVVALGATAAEVLARSAPEFFDGRDGTAAFVYGLMVGHRLASPHLLPERSLWAAADAVGERGRCAVIADHCDLGAVGTVERRCSDTLLGEGADTRVRTFYESLFEIGLAVSLAVYLDSARIATARTLG